VQICTYNAKGVELLNYHDQELTLDHLEIWKQSTLEETGAPKPKERTMTVLNLTEGLGLTEAGIKVSKGQWYEQTAATTGQEFTWTLACYEEILKQKTKALPCQS